MTPPVTSSCFVNLVRTLLPWGLGMETWCVDVPAPFASAAGACMSPLHILYNKATVGSEGQTCDEINSVHFSAEQAFRHLV